MTPGGEAKSQDLRDDRPAGDRDRVRALTVPNIVTIGRMGASIALIWIAHAGLAWWFIGLFILLALTDWVDGKLAMLLDQRSELGARLDSIGDFVLYACLMIGAAMLDPEFVRANAVLIGVMIGSYALPLVVTLVRFRRLPAFHTRAAKTCWLLVSIGAVVLLAGGPDWPAQLVLVAVTLTNLEAAAIALVLRQWRADVTSIWHAVRRLPEE